jgi:fucose 4-O-acetylase-like acetyltransferase
MLSQWMSQKFKFWAFVSMVLLVFVHGYNLDQRYLQPWTIPYEPLTPTSFTEYFLANGIFRFRIPMLFIISGYLYALNDQLPNGQRIRKRLRTLLLPYLIWSGAGMGLIYLLELFPYTRNFLMISHFVQIDNTRLLIHDYHWYEVLARWLFFPVSYQLWFIRVLLIYNIAYPLIRWCVTHSRARWIFFTMTTLLWLSTMGFVFFEGEGLLFFSLGVWMQKSSFTIEIPQRGLKPLLWGVAFIILALIKTILAFKAENMNGVLPIITLMHKVVVLSGLIACWYGSDGLVKWSMSKPWFAWLSSFSFIIYALHAPLVAIGIDPVFDGLRYIEGYRILTFILLPLTVILFCIATGAILRKTAPKLYAVLTGGRGM